MKANHIAVSIMLAVAIVGCGGNPVGPPAATTTSSSDVTAAASGPSQSAAALLAAAGPVTAEVLDTAIRLHWPSVPNAQGYFIHRDGNALPLNTTPVSDTTYDDIGLSNGRPYRYSVVAVDRAGHSLSRFTEITVTAATP